MIKLSEPRPVPVASVSVSSCHSSPNLIAESSPKLIGVSSAKVIALGSAKEIMTMTEVWSAILQRHRSLEVWQMTFPRVDMDLVVELVRLHRLGHGVRDGDPLSLGLAFPENRKTLSRSVEVLDITGRYLVSMKPGAKRRNRLLVSRTAFIGRCSEAAARKHSCALIPRSFSP